VQAPGYLDVAITGGAHAAHTTRSSTEGMPTDHRTLPGTVARSGDEAATRVRVKQITSTYRAE
jgi:hypothetical protein